MQRWKGPSLGVTSGLVFCAAFTLIGANGSFSSYSNSSSSIDSVAFPNCNGTKHFIGDGYCDGGNNNVVCMLANVTMDSYMFCRVRE